MTLVEAQPFLSERVRFDREPNRLGLSGLDHVGIPCRDVEHTGKFLEQVLGGVLLARLGFSEEERKLGMMPHAFYHVGSQLVEVAQVRDSTLLDHMGANGGQPHWAFGTSPERLVDFMGHLDEQGVAYAGPFLHPGSTSVSVYFRDPDGNTLEVTTWEESALLKPIPPEQFMQQMRSRSQHNWQPR